MSSDRQLNYVNNLQNRDQNLYYIDDASELNSINLEENDKIYAINNNKLFQMEIIDREEELSGSIVSFNGRNNTKIKSIVANIEPKQDLHGYNNPWPKGSGKNLLDNTLCTARTAQGIERIVNTDGTITLNGTNTTYSFWWKSTDTMNVPLKAGTYTLSATSSTPGIQIALLISTDSGNVDKSRTFTLDSDATIVNVRFTAEVGTTLNNVVVKPQLELGSTATAWSPYSNICPINGQTGAEVTGMGVNVWDEEWEMGRLDFDSNSPAWGQNVDTAQQIRSKNYIRLASGVTYYCAFQGTTTIYAIFYDAYKNPVLSTAGIGYLTINNINFTTPDNACYMRFYVIEASDYTNKISINYPATDTAYHAYEGNQISVTFPSSARTVYGGTLTINPDRTGELVVDRAGIDMGTLSWTKRPTEDASAMVYRTQLDNRKFGTDSEKIRGQCSQYSFWRNASINPLTNTMPNGYFGFQATNGGILVRDDRYSTTEDFIEAMSGVMLVYPLAEPITYPLTASEIDGILTTLYGTNNIWADCGNINIKIAEKGKTAFELKPYT